MLAVAYSEQAQLGFHIWHVQSTGKILSRAPRVCSVGGCASLPCGQVYMWFVIKSCTVENITIILEGNHVAPSYDRYSLASDRKPFLMIDEMKLSRWYRGSVWSWSQFMAEELGGCNQSSSSLLRWPFSQNNLGINAIAPQHWTATRTSTNLVLPRTSPYALYRTFKHLHNYTP